MWNLKTLAVTGIVFTMSLAGTAWYAYNSGKQSGMQEVQTLWTAERLAMSEALVEEQMKARQREQALAALNARLVKEHRDEVNRISREYAALADSLRDRPDRPSEGGGGVSENPNAGTEHPAGCTGASLFAEDSEFLVRESARADQLRIALKACLADRAEIERQLNLNPNP